MPDRIGWGSLLRRAAELYDAPGSELAAGASAAGRRGFRSGAEWMRRAMEILRCSPIPEPASANFHALGLLKYGAACVVASGWVLAIFAADWPVLGLFAVPLFYAAEAQGVFLFPVAIDGDPRPFRSARRFTVRAGGTFRVMAVVMPIAAAMLFGGFVGRGFLRSWCLGCLAICVWYERLRGSHAL